MSNLEKLGQRQYFIYSALRNQVTKELYYSTSIAAAYAVDIAYSLQKDDNIFLDFQLEKILNSIQDTDIRDFVAGKLKGIDFSGSSIGIGFWGDEIGKNYILDGINELPFSIYPTTASSVLEIASQILDIKDGESVFSAGQDLTSLIYRNTNIGKQFNYTYSDVIIDNTAIAKIKIENLRNTKEFNNINFGVQNKDFMLLESSKLFDKSFIHLPFNLRVYSYDYDEFKKATPSLKLFKKPNTLDWPFMLKLVQGIKEGGKAVALAIMGTTYNVNDRQFRKYLIEKGLIEAVIALPGKLLNDTSVQTALYVFSHNNTSVKLIDATNVCETGRRQNVITKENIETILSAYHNNDEVLCAVVSTEELEANDYTLIPSRYLNQILYLDGGWFSNICTIRRGASLRADKLDEITTIDHTDFQYLMLADISDGIINEDLSFITRIDDSLRNFIIKENNIVLSKIGAPFKVAIMDKRDTEIIANGNLYILEIDDKRVDPYYLQAFLQSDEGQKLLTSVATGTTFSTISIKDLSSLTIPLPPLAAQKAIGKSYKETQNEIISLTKKLEKSKNKILALFDKNRKK